MHLGSRPPPINSQSVYPPFVTGQGFPPPIIPICRLCPVSQPDNLDTFFRCQIQRVAQAPSHTISPPASVPHASGRRKPTLGELEREAHGLRPRLVPKVSRTRLM